VIALDKRQVIRACCADMHAVLQYVCQCACFYAVPSDPDPESDLRADEAPLCHGTRHVAYDPMALEEGRCANAATDNATVDPTQVPPVTHGPVRVVRKAVCVDRTPEVQHHETALLPLVAVTVNPMAPSVALPLPLEYCSSTSSGTSDDDDARVREDELDDVDVSGDADDPWHAC
jgi:hypothetical protein